MSNPSPDLSDIRSAIDALDREIIALIAARQRFVEAAGVAKAGQGRDAVRAPARVEAVIARVRAEAAAVGASPAVVEATYRAMIAAFVELELGVHAGER
ncbi:MAG: chorismate mutase [Microterricola sp.]